jgi:hypothetical protein
MRSLLVRALPLAACTGDTKEPSRPAAETCDLADFPSSYTQVAPVEIHRDDRNIPHIYAQNDADLFYAAGYQAGTDRLFEIDTFLRAAKGTLSEVRGEESYLDDVTARTFDFDRHACDSIALIAADRPDDYTLVLAYVTGLNRRIAEVRAGEAALPWGFGPAELDYLPEPLDVSDVVAIGRLHLLGRIRPPRVVHRRRRPHLPHCHRVRRRRRPRIAGGSGVLGAGAGPRNAPLSYAYGPAPTGAARRLIILSTIARGDAPTSWNTNRAASAVARSRGPLPTKCPVGACRESAAPSGRSASSAVVTCAKVYPRHTSARA